MGCEAINLLKVMGIGKVMVSKDLSCIMRWNLIVGNVYGTCLIFAYSLTILCSSFLIVILLLLFVEFIVRFESLIICNEEIVTFFNALKYKTNHTVLLFRKLTYPISILSFWNSIPLFFIQLFRKGLLLSLGKKSLYLVRVMVC